STPATLSLGAVDEVDQTWVNGVAVGAGAGGQRRYALAPGTLRAGENQIVTAIINTYKLGGLVGPAELQRIEFKDGGVVSLKTPWRYRIAASAQENGFPPRAPWEALAGISVIYNGMIAPIGVYALKGAVWYQGESDTGEPDSYRTKLSALMNDWRRRFGADLPFLIVQLPGYGAAPTEPEDSWAARLRDSQRAAASADDNAALVVTIDIGDPYDVHPANKQEVGRRLASAARRLVYGDNVDAVGPTATRALRKGDEVAISFNDVEGDLVAHGALRPIGFELCGAEEGTCRYVDASIKANQVLLAIPRKFAPVRVRYCWAESPVCTLSDESELPAGPFELPVEIAN
ncbi:MAG: sialate O-acetylesterase, partial [Amphiplicatus sp.]